MKVASDGPTENKMFTRDFQGSDRRPGNRPGGGCDHHRLNSSPRPGADSVHRREGDQPLRIPLGAVVVPSARAMSRGSGRDWGLSLYTPVIIKYRDEKTDQSVRLEELLR